MSNELRIDDIIVGDRDRQELGDIAVYAAIDEQGETLYIGQTNMLRRRLCEHRRFAPWWQRAAEVQVIRDRLSRPEALDLERHLIRSCHPKFNVAHGDSTAAAQEIALERLRESHRVATVAEALAVEGVEAHEYLRGMQ